MMNDFETGWMSGGAESCLFFITAMIFSYVHERAHLAAARACSSCAFMQARGPFGNVMFLDPDISDRKKVLIYLAGPMSNIVIAAAVLSVAEIMSEGRFESFTGMIAGERIASVCTDAVESAMQMMVMANAMLAAFNLLPFFPLDGGRIAVIFMSVFTGNDAAMKIASVFSLFFAVCIFISGLYLVKYNLLNIILIADALYFIYILERERHGPYR